MAYIPSPARGRRWPEGPDEGLRAHDSPSPQPSPAKCGRGGYQCKESIMAGSVNKVILIGNLGKDPKVANLNSGDRVVSFTLATSESWKDKNTGERKERTEWHNIVVYNENIGRVVEQYCK